MLAGLSSPLVAPQYPVEIGFLKYIEWYRGLAQLAVHRPREPVRTRRVKILFAGHKTRGVACFEALRSRGHDIVPATAARDRRGDGV